MKKLLAFIGVLASLGAQATLTPLNTGGGPPSGAAGGELSGTYPNPILSNAAVIAKVLTGYAAGAGTVSASDSLLQAVQKLDGNDGLRVLKAGDTMTGPLTLTSVTASGAVQGATVNVTGATASRALVTDASKNVTSSAVTSTELGYLSGVTGPIQTQIGNYVLKSGDTMTGNLTVPLTSQTQPSLITGGSGGSTTGFSSDLTGRINAIISGTTKLTFDANGIALPGSGRFFLNGGNVGSPALTVISNSGFYGPASETIAIGNAGVETGRFTSTNAFLLGTTSNPNSWTQRIGSNTNGSINAFGVANTNAGSSAAVGLRLENDTDVNGYIVRNSSTNTAYAGAGSLNVGTVGATALGFFTNNTLRSTLSSGGIFTNTGQIQGPSASAATPTFSFSGATDTGLFHPGSGTLGFSAGGFVRMSISTDGQILINGGATLGSHRLYINPNGGTDRGLLIRPNISSTAVGGYGGGLTVKNENNTVNNLAMMTFASSNDTITSFMGTRITDHTNGYGELIFGNRSAAGYTEKLTLRGDGELRYNGSTSGYVGLISPAAPTSYTVTLPTAAPTTNGQVLSATTGGTAKWSGANYNAYITNGGSCAVSSQSGDNTWISSVSRPGTGQCTITIAAGVFGSAPWCSCTPEGTTSKTCSIDNSSISATSVTFSTFTTIAADSNFYIRCQRN